MKNKRYSAADYSHKVFTEDGGIKNHESKLQTKGAFKFVAVALVINLLHSISIKIQNTEIKAKKLKKRDE